MLVDNTALLVGVLLVSGLVCGVTGFGFGLVAMGALVAIMPVQDATVIVCVASLLISMLNAWTVRGAIRWREIAPLLVTAIPAVGVGVYLLKRLDAQVLQMGVAAMILAGCVVTLWSPRRALINGPVPWAYMAGALGGTFGGALGTGGPPVVLYALLRGWDKSGTKSAIAMFFVISNLWRLALLIATGVASREMMQTGALMLIPVMLASYLGTLIFARLSTPVFRYAVMVLLVGLAAKSFLA
jgi:uncharacterized membrane protein YfcA